MSVLATMLTDDAQKTMSRPRLLCLAPQEPWPATDGGKEGIHGAVQSLAVYADVLLACPASTLHEEAVVHFAMSSIDYRVVCFEPVETLRVVLSSCIRLKPFKFHKYCTSEAEHLFDAAIGPFEPDAIVCFHAHMEELGQRLRKRRGWSAPIVVREHNIEYEMVESYLSSRPILQRIVGAPIAWLTRWAEIRMWSRADVIAFLTERDFKVGRTSGAQGHLILAPEGVPLPSRRRARPPKDQPRLLIPLNRKAPQSIASLKIFMDVYWRPSATLTEMESFELVITGADPSQLAAVVQMTEAEQDALRVRATGFLPSLQPVFASSMLLIAPTFVGSGIRKKVLEGMANQIPVMGTEMDLRACTYFKSGHNILQLGLVDEFRQSVIRLRDDPTMWQALSDNGRDTVERNADWDLFANAIMQGLAVVDKKRFSAWSRNTSQS
jgi:glycosyltransferase involved in cell wall biosynthesis